MNLGKHVLVDFKVHPEVSFMLFNDPTLIRRILRSAIEEVNATIMNVSEHDFGPVAGFTLNFSLSESHATIHTWPEHNAATMDIYMCGDCDSGKALNIFFEQLEDTVNLMTGNTDIVTEKHVQTVYRGNML